MENNFERMMRICMMDQLFMYLSPSFFSECMTNHYYSYNTIRHQSDLFELIRSSKNMYRIMKISMIKHHAFADSNIMHWNEKNLKYIHKLNVQIDRNMFLAQMLNMTNNLQCLHIKQTYKDFPFSRREISEIINIPLNLKCLQLNISIPVPLSEKTFPGCFGKRGSLTQLLFGDNYKFNDPIENIFPDSLTYLSFGSWRNQLSKNLLPKNLTYLSFGRDSKGNGFNHPIESGVLPDSLTQILFESFNCQLDSRTLPKNLTSLSLSSFTQRIEKNMFPPSLKYLSFGIWNRPLEIDSLPQNLQTLHFDEYNHPLTPGILPSTIRSLSFGKKIYYHNEFNNLANEFNQQLKPGVFPDSLLELSLGNNFSEKLNPWVLPKNLTKLSLGNRWNHHISKNILPSTLRDIAFGINFSEGLANNVVGTKALPNIERIQIPDDYKYKNRLMNMVNNSVIITYIKTNKHSY
jgi:hypothetical protein